MAISDQVGAFCAHGLMELQTQDHGPLAGATFGVKDLFDVAGLPTGAGSPEWLRTHATPTRTASSVQKLLDAGARFVGKTATDELAWSLNGQNAHYGTPINTAAPDRIPGGSSSGSATATAAGLVDFAVGSDTGGSVRLPASYCGLYGFRPTHGRIAIDGAVPLAPSYDTVGWFAREPEMLARVGAVLLESGAAASLPRRLLVAEDLFTLAGSDYRTAIKPSLKQLERLLGPAQSVDVAGGELIAWRDAFRLIQSQEAWQTHGEWVTRIKPSFGPGIGDRFAAAASLDPHAVAEARSLRAAIRLRLDDLLPAGTVLIAPTAQGVAPLRTATGHDLEAFRASALALLCPAGHAGLPQLSLPLGRLGGLPVGLSLIGSRGEDEALIDLAQRLSLPVVKESAAS